MNYFDQHGLPGTEEELIEVPVFTSNLEEIMNKAKIIHSSFVENHQITSFRLFISYYESLLGDINSLNKEMEIQNSKSTARQLYYDGIHEARIVKKWVEKKEFLMEERNFIFDEFRKIAESLSLYFLRGFRDCCPYHPEISKFLEENGKFAEYLAKEAGVYDEDLEEFQEDDDLEEV